MASSRAVGRNWAIFTKVRHCRPLPTRPSIGTNASISHVVLLPWHRAYLISFEEIVRAAIVELHGPTDWALPYWNYSSATVQHALAIPEAFTQAKLPDGSDNPLHVEARFGTGVHAADADLNGRITKWDSSTMISQP